MIKSRYFLALSAAVAASSAHAVLIQDFEVDTSGVDGLSSGAGENFAVPGTPNPVRVESNAGDFLPDVPTSAAGGNWFLEVRMGYDDGPAFAVIQGDRVLWNSGGGSGGFQSGWGHRVDVFFDDPNATLDGQPLEPGGGNAAYGAGDGFFFQATLMDDTNSFAINGGGFGVRLIDDAGTLTWTAGADGNARGYAGATGPTSLFETAAPGWFTMETIWVDNAGVVDQVNTIYDIAGNVEYTETFTAVMASVSDVGALGAATFGNGDLDAVGAQAGPNSFIGAVGIDNVAIVPEPRTYALFAGIFVILASVFSRRK